MHVANTIRTLRNKKKRGDIRIIGIDAGYRIPSVKGVGFAREPELTWVDLSIDDVTLDETATPVCIYLRSCTRVRVHARE